MGVLHKFSALLFSSGCENDNELYNNTKEGAYIPFSLSKPKNYQIYNEFLSTSINSNKFLPIYLGRELKGSRSIYIYKCASLNVSSFKEWHIYITVKFKKRSLLACPAVFSCSTRWLT
jgi:hypothetical protein